MQYELSKYVKPMLRAFELYPELFPKGEAHSPVREARSLVRLAGAAHRLRLPPGYRDRSPR
jgi:hypothetical protein